MIKSVKPKKCVCGCGDSFIPRRSTDKWLNSDHYKHWLLNTPQGQREIERKALRAKKQVQKDERVKDNVIREKLKTLGQYESDAKKEIQKWVRKRDSNLPCISCGTFTSDLWDGGHFKKAEIYSGVIFDEMNIHRQCRKCNRFLGGNELNFREGLIARYGEDYVLNIEKKALETRNYKFNKEELKELREKYRLLNKE
jgi:DNA-directed RNA polymerase subunit N (RpoN/RPB10)